MPEAKTFRSAQEFRRWLARNHGTVSALEVRCFKVQEAERGLTYKQAVDEALCHGWIDGVRHALDEISFRVRFTPRKARSIWSRINLARVEELIAEGRMARAGLYSFEREERLRGDAAAWRFFQGQPPWYQRTAAFWVMSAKREETRDCRFATLLACSGEGKRIGPLARAGKGEG